MKKIIFPGPFKSSHSENKMKDEGNVKKSREIFLRKRFKNLDYLLRNRFSWMNSYIKPGMKIVEVGCGSGFSQLYIEKPVTLTDMILNAWVEKKIDAMNMSFSNDSIDIIIASNAIHHFYSPAKFFLECHRVLKNNGLILINETTTSLTMRSIMKLMKHEAYDFGVDVFDENVICNDKNDPWSANCAVSELLFTNEEIFNKKFFGLKIINQEFCEFSIFLLSGGVVSKVPMVELPKILLNLFNVIDKVLIFFFPSIFALSRRVVIKKNS